MKKSTVILIFQGICAMGAGMSATLGLVAMLSLYGGIRDVSSAATARALHFPENEQMLDAISSELAREGEALSKTEPAAGNKTPDSP